MIEWCNKTIINQTIIKEHKLMYKLQIMILQIKSVTELLPP